MRGLGAHLNADLPLLVIEGGGRAQDCAPTWWCQYHTSSRCLKGCTWKQWRQRAGELMKKVATVEGALYGIIEWDHRGRIQACL